MKTVTIYFYGEGESEVAKEFARQDRAQQQVAMIREAVAFNGEVEQCNRVVILEGVGHKRALIEATYRGIVQPARGSSKWAGGPFNTEDHLGKILPADVLAKSRGEDWTPPEAGRSNVEVQSYRSPPIAAATATDRAEESTPSQAGSTEREGASAVEPVVENARPELPPPHRPRKKGASRKGRARRQDAPLPG